MGRYLFFIVKFGLFVFVLHAFTSCSTKKYDKPHILISTRFGDIEAELYPDKAKQTVAAFVAYISKGLYKNTSFYRVLKADDMPGGFSAGIIQGGLWQLKTNLIPDGIAHEPTSISGLSHTDGTLSLARTKPGTASSEFFICIGDQTQFDAGRSGTQDSLGFAAFGKVISGMSVVKKIQAEKSTGDKFDNKIDIDNIEIL